MYSRHYLIDRFKRSNGERAAIAYLKKKESERLGRRAKLKKVLVGVTVVVIGIAWWTIIILI